MNGSLPDEVRPLMWDVDPAQIRLDQHRNFILDRVLEYGTMDAVRWAERTYGRGGIREYFLARGQRVLSQKTQAYRRLILQLDACTTTSSPPPKNRLWSY
ncbi:MAG: hypothetical protein NZ483_02680 [Verrucomicrobiae bacterium]|nr:hypothetical protein [Verrucomicrobiae bacterium]